MVYPFTHAKVGKPAPSHGKFRLSIVQICWLAELLLLQAAPLLFGQLATNATLGGTVLDSTGAAVPEATVTLSNPDKGFSRVFTSGADGRYLFSLIPPGTYALRVEKTGFKSYNQTGIILNVGQAASQDVTLEVGAVTQEINVSASAPLLNTTNADIGTDVAGKQVIELPLNWRSPYRLVMLDSSVNDSTAYQIIYGNGAMQGGGEQDASQFSFGGNRFGDNAFLLDGHWNGDGDWNSLIYAPSVDELQEMKIQKYSYSAQYGWSGGNAVNAVTKGGTDAFHGDAYDFLRNSVLDSNNWFNDAFAVRKPNFARNQFGLTAGGPLYIPKLYEQRNKTFIFGVYEGLREATPSTLVTTIPTPAMLTGDYSALLGPSVGTDALGRPILSGQIYDPFTTRTITAGAVDPTTGLVATQSGYIRDPIPGNMIPPALQDPVGKKLMSYYPSPTNSAVTNNFVVSFPSAISNDRYSVRLDQNISDKSRFFARWSQERISRFFPLELFGPSDLAGPGADNPEPRFDFGTNYTHVFNPSTVLSVTAGYGRWQEGFVGQSYGKIKPSALGLPSFLDVTPDFPGIGVSDVYGLGSTDTRANPRDVRSLAVDLTKVHGDHSMLMGFMGVEELTYDWDDGRFLANFSRAMSNGPNPTAADVVTGYGPASLLMGASDGGSITHFAASAIEKDYLGWYLQDNWKATRKLTLNLGLRYDMQTAPTERHNRSGYFDPTAANPISSAIGFTVPGEWVYQTPSHRGDYNAQKDNVAPRVGLAYEMTSKLVLRAGFGLFYTPTLESGDYQGLNLYGYTQTTPYVGTLNGITPLNLISNPIPGGLIAPVGNANGGLTEVGQGITAVLPTRPTPYMEQWSAGFQYGFSPNDNLDVLYVGNHGIHLSYGNGNPNIDQLPDKDLALGNQLINEVTNPFYGHLASSGCGLSSPTVTQGQLLLPYPEYCGVASTQMEGAGSSYNSLQVNYTHRVSKGAQVLASFTLSKYLDQSDGPDAWVAPYSTYYDDVYNLAAEKSLAEDDIPKSLVVSYIYELPIGRGKSWGSGMSKPLNGVVGGWQLSGTTTFKDGFPIGIEDGDNNTGSYGGNQRPNLIGDPHVSNPSVNEWFNTAAFAQPAPYTFGDVPRTEPNLRVPGRNNWDFAAEKWWNWKEKVRVQFRAEFYNFFNHPNFFAPGDVFGSATFGQITSAGPARDVQAALKVYW